MDARRTAARFAAPAAFLLAATIAVLLVRSALGDETVAPPPAPVTTAATTTAPVTTEPEGPTETTATTTAGAEFYEIEGGDTLETIASAHGTTVEQLLVLNPDVDPVALSIGQRIRVK